MGLSDVTISDLEKGIRAGFLHPLEDLPDTWRCPESKSSR
jgi:rubredoxin